MVCNWASSYVENRHQIFISRTVGSERLVVTSSLRHVSEFCFQVVSGCWPKSVLGLGGTIIITFAPAARQVKGRGTMRTYFVDAPMQQDMALQDVPAQPRVIAPNEATMRSLVAQDVKAIQATAIITGQDVLAMDAMLQVGYGSKPQLQAEASQLSPIISMQLFEPSNLPPSEAERMIWESRLATWYFSHSLGPYTNLWIQTTTNSRGDKALKRIGWTSRQASFRQCWPGLIKMCLEAAAHSLVGRVPDSISGTPETAAACHSPGEPEAETTPLWSSYHCAITVLLVWSRTELNFSVLGSRTGRGVRND